MERKPVNILWVAAGNPENESLVSLFSQLVKQTPWNVNNTLVTNCDFKQFPGNTYHCVEVNKKDSLSEKYFKLVLAILTEGLVSDVDIVITGGITASIWLHTLAMENNRFRERPIVYVSPKVSEKSVAELAGGGEDEDLFWWLVGRKNNIWAVVLDNDREVDLANRRIIKVCSYSGKRVLRLVLWQNQGLKEVAKTDKVIWSGRYNIIKRPDEALRIMALLKGQGVQCEMFVVAASSQYRAQIVKARDVIDSVYVGLEREAYLSIAGGAKVLLVTSEVEGFPLGYIEMVERGVVPVIRSKPWMKTFLGEDWPLSYTTAGEAVSMCFDVLAEYDKWLAVLKNRLAQRYCREPNWRDMMDSIWGSYVADDYRHDFSLKKQGRGVL